MRVDSTFFGRLGKAIVTSSPEAGDASLHVPPTVNLTVPLGTPIRLCILGATVEDAAVISNVRAITNAVGQSETLMTLTPGVWRVRINFSAVQDFAGFAAGAAIQIRTVPAGGLIDLIKFTPVVSFPQWGYWEETLYLGAPTDFIQLTPAAGAAQNTASAAQMIAQRLL